MKGLYRMTPKKRTTKKHILLILKSLKFKFFIMNLIIVLGMFLLFGSILLKTIYDSTSKQTFNTAQESFLRISTFIEEKAADLRNTIDASTLDTKTAEILVKNKHPDYKEILKWNIDYVTINEKISNSIFYSSIENIRVVTTHPIATAYPNYLFVPISQVKSTPWYEFANTSLDSFFWDPPSDFLQSDHFNDSDYMMFTRYLPYNYYTYPTYFVGYVPKSVFYHLMTVDNSIPYGSCFLMNTQGEYITDQSIDVDKSALDLIHETIRTTNDSILFDRINIDDHSYYLGVSKISRTNFSLVYIYEHYKMSRSIINTNLQRMLVIMCITLPFVLIFSILLTFSLTRRIDELKHNMLEASKGNFELGILSASESDEISILNKHFNYMVTKISILMDDQYRNGQRIKELEFISLQSQINPHFLYNTLDLIRWKAVKNHDEEINNLILALSDYYRFALSKGNELVTIESELDHIKVYIQIQNMRFDNSISLSIDVPEDILLFKIPKLTLQPIVENAIVHGIFEKEDSVGTITIHAKKDSSCYLSIEDDGVGIAKNDLPAILQEVDLDHLIEAGYGLHNINERIKLSFGEAYGLHIKSTVGKGTTIMICLPLQDPSI